MDRWTATAQANTSPEHLLEVLTHPEQIRCWSPIDFEVEDLEGRRLAAGTRTKVSGRLAGVPVSFEVEVHAADARRLELSADGRSASTCATSWRPAPPAPSSPPRSPFGAEVGSQDG